MACLKKGGLWQGLRQFPALDFADSDHSPAMIIVAMDGNDLFSPRPDIILKDNIAAFEAGMAVFAQIFTKACRGLPGEQPGRHLGDRPFRGGTDHPYRPGHLSRPGTPGAVLYQIKQQAAENSAWCIRLDHLVMMGRFFTFRPVSG